MTLRSSLKWLMKDLGFIPFPSWVVVVMYFLWKKLVISQNDLYLKLFRISRSTTATGSFVCQRLLEGHILLCLVQLVHPFSNGLAIGAFYKCTPTAHCVLLCLGWKFSAITTALSPNPCYSPLWDSCTYINFSRATELMKLWLSMSCLEHLYLCNTFPTPEYSWTFRWLSTSIANSLFLLGIIVTWTFTCIHDQREEFVWFLLGSNAYI